MSDFSLFKKGIQEQFDLMIKDQEQLFLVDIEKDDLWEKYLESFPTGTNEVYRERREYDCSSCRHFIKNYGRVVAIKDNKVMSMWDAPTLPYPFDVVAGELSKIIKTTSIKDVFVTKFIDLGVNSNRELMEDGSVKVWQHLFYKLPEKFITQSAESMEAIQGSLRDSRNVFERSMKELTLDAGNTILELIEQGSLYRGAEHKGVISTFLSYKIKYDALSSPTDKENWCWINSFKNPVARIRNSAVGTLLIDLSSGVDIDTAVTKFEKVMAPSNYKRPKAIFTKKMIEQAQKDIEDLGFSDSLGRRHSRLSDITVNNVLFVNRGVKDKLKGSDTENAFESLKGEVSEKPKNFSKVEEVSIEDFMSNIMPKAESIDLMIENNHQKNLMSLISPKDLSAPTMFKWNNNFSWSYFGDITDSMKQNVKKAGGNVEGVLRFSIQWNENGDNENDLDAHCIEPNGNLIYYQNKKNRSTTGNLDVDIIDPNGEVAVENITWLDINKMQEGKYTFLVHNFSNRGGRSGFKAEIEYDGQIYSYEYALPLKTEEKVIVAEINFSRKEGISFVKSLDSSMSSKDMWGIKTNHFTPVSVIMFSPNYWNEQKGIGNRHYFFFMQDCKNETLPRGFYNEFLKEDLLKHKRVFEALGSKMRVEDSEQQLSGLGFSSTQRDSIIARVKGSFSRVLKINF